MPCKLVGIAENNMDKNFYLLKYFYLTKKFKFIHRQGNTPSRMRMDNGRFRRPDNTPGLSLEKGRELILQISCGLIP